MNKQNKGWRVLIALMALSLLSGCWYTGTTQLVGIVTQVSHDGSIWQTCEADLHVVDAKGVMVSSSHKFSVDSEDQYATNAEAQLRAAQEAGTRVRVTLHHEMFTTPWRGEENWFVDKVELLP